LLQQRLVAVEGVKAAQTLARLRLQMIDKLCTGDLHLDLANGSQAAL
jgi:hypothetical protein